MKLRSILAAFVIVLLPLAARAAEIKLLASGTKKTCLDLIPPFEASSGHKVVPNWAGTVAIKKKVAAGEAYDVIIVATPEIDAFTREGRIVPDSRAAVMKSAVGVVVAVRAGNPKPDIG